jgi:hypothetical protein
MFDCLQSSPPPAHADASHQPLDLAAPISGENLNSDLLRVKPGQQNLDRDGLHLARIPDLSGKRINEKVEKARNKEHNVPPPSLPPHPDSPLFLQEKLCYVKT